MADPPGPHATSESVRLRHRHHLDVMKRVCFDRVTIREYERAIGDSPAVSSGPPIGLDWGYYNAREYDVEVFENHIRLPGPRTRRHFFLSPQKRFHMLLDEWGYSVQEICHAKDEAAEIRRWRHLSAAAPVGNPDRYQSDPNNRDVPPTTTNRRRTRMDDREDEDASIDDNNVNHGGSDHARGLGTPMPSSRAQDRWNPCPSPVPA